MFKVVPDRAVAPGLRRLRPLSRGSGTVTPRRLFPPTMAASRASGTRTGERDRMEQKISLVWSKALGPDDLPEGAIPAEREPADG